MKILAKSLYDSPMNILDFSQTPQLHKVKVNGIRKCNYLKIKINLALCIIQKFLYAFGVILYINILALLK